MNYLKRVLREEAGNDTIEYGLLVVFVSLAAIAALQALGPFVNAVYTAVRNALH